MVIGCLLALAFGGLASFAMPLLPFLIAVLLVVVLGGGTSLLLLPVTTTGVVAAASMFAASQVGYGLGLAVIGMSGRPSRRAVAQRQFRAPPAILRHHTPPDT